MPDRKTTAERRREAAAARRREIAACGRCDPNGWLIIAGRAHRCTHREDQSHA
ncbi:MULTISPECIES: hypothetical protein [Gordonia]|uniref:hypothetical protein n=1 Tax=Gordonia TaxID=2053 RepID=UPI000AC9F8B6|nr:MULTISPECIES: hypothetical protein [Gordonia]WFN94152.1 hypothetical protein P5P27_06295 [Gordonia sihwensis]WFN94213.1 hypothetical protein P5P27_06605 [Gordonia sihwensis]